MGAVGVAIGAGTNRPEWNMTHEEAGRNAAKMALYYAILRCGSRERGCATALYNSYGFGYALGAHFCDRQGRREMLWPQDLDEIAADGVTRNGCRLR